MVIFKGHLLKRMFQDPQRAVNISGNYLENSQLYGRVPEDRLQRPFVRGHSRIFEEYGSSIGKFRPVQLESRTVPPDFSKTFLIFAKFGGGNHVAPAGSQVGFCIK